LLRDGHEVMIAGVGLSIDPVVKFYGVTFFDLIMPKIDGDKLIQIIRSIPHLRPVSWSLFHGRGEIIQLQKTGAITI
jgi:hypothetical protein